MLVFQVADSLFAGSGDVFEALDGAVENLAVLGQSADVFAVLSGESLEVFARKYADARPHVHIPSAHSVADLGLQVAAYFGIDGNLPTYTARGQLLKSLPGTDEEKAAALAYLDQAYQWDPKTRKAGIPPDDFHKALESAAAIAEADAAEKRAKALRLTANSTKPTPKADHRTNPWSKENWNVTAQGNCVRALGAEKASRIAAAVGCVLGSTKPSPHY